jgi:hypothetical protein
MKWTAIIDGKSLGGEDITDSIQANTIEELIDQIRQIKTAEESITTISIYNEEEA